MYSEGGWLPKWPNPSYTNIMVGTHADAVIADAYVKGFHNFDVHKAYEAVYKDAFTPPQGDTGNVHWVAGPWGSKKPEKLPPGAGNPWWDREDWAGYEARGGLTWYMKYGYVPCDMTRESVTRTLEYAYDDYSVAQFALAIGKTEDYNKLMSRSQYYKNVYNKERGFMAPRLSNGLWSPDSMKLIQPIGPEEYLGFTEGSPWTYLFGAVQDIKGLIELMGGNEKFSAKLDRNFEGNFYKHDNEPGHHYIYLYDYCKQPWKTQELARIHTTINYRNTPDGINGNDDCGQMSAWYIFGCMGFYPVCPGSTEYAVGAPQFSQLTIWLNKERTKKIFIQAKNLSEKNKYIKSMTVNGKVRKKPFLNHSDISNGAEILFEMTDAPSNFFSYD
jgi:predicted alpha-1,2-mannosidase